MDSLPTVTVTSLPDPLPGDLTVLDVREPVEWEHGHIAGAVHIPMADLPGRLDDVPGGPTLVVCRIGGRSAQVTAYLQASGHDATNLDGGMVEWARAGRPMVSEADAPPRVV